MGRTVEVFEIVHTLDPEHQEKVKEKLTALNDTSLNEKLASITRERISIPSQKLDYLWIAIMGEPDEIEGFMEEIRSQVFFLCPANASEEFKLMTECNSIDRQLSRFVKSQPEKQSKHDLIQEALINRKKELIRQFGQHEEKALWLIRNSDLFSEIPREDEQKLLRDLANTGDKASLAVAVSLMEEMTEGYSKEDQHT